LSEKVPTLADVARVAGVSPATVSRVLRGYAQVAADTRARVLREARRLGYQRTPANPRADSGRASGETGSAIRGLNRLKVLVDVHAEEQFTPVLVELLQIGAAHRFEVTIERYEHGTLVDRATELQSMGFDAVVVLTMEVIPVEDARELRELLIPVVLVNRYVQGLTFSVTLDDFAAGCHAARYLYDLGHRRIAYLQGDLSASSMKDRADGFRAELTRLGVYDPSLFLETGGRTHRFHERVAECMKRLLAEEEPVTAVWAWNDATALTAIAAAHTLGVRVPEDISVMGFDRMSAQTPWRLTTFDYRFRDLAQATGALLQIIFNGTVQQPMRLCVTPTLVIGHTTAPPRSDRRPGIAL